MFDVLANLVAAFYALIPNYAVAIALLTIVVMLVLSPFTWKSTRSMIALQRLQPEIKRLQTEHKGDRQALNEAMMAFYQEHKINPLSSCLPMLLQMPVLIVMFQVIRGLTHSGGPKYVSQDTRLFTDLREAGGDMVAFGMNLARTANEGGPKSIPLYFLIALVVATSFWQTKQMSSRNPSAAANPQAKIMQRVFPLLSGFISFSLPGGVVLYFLISNLFRIAQQSLMYRFDPTLNAAVRKEVQEVEAKAEEIKHRPKAAKPETAPARRPPTAPTSGRVTPKATPSRRPGSRRSRRRARGR